MLVLACFVPSVLAAQTNATNDVAAAISASAESGPRASSYHQWGLSTNAAYSPGEVAFRSEAIRAKKIVEGALIGFTLGALAGGILEVVTAEGNGKGSGVAGGVLLGGIPGAIIGAAIASVVEARGD